LSAVQRRFVVARHGWHVEWKEHSEGFAGLEKAHVEDAFWMTSYSTETD
jgi:hypothetical protein